jgi:hypothetical protein
MRMRWEGAWYMWGEKTNVRGVLVRKPAGNRPTGRTRHKWENIKMDLG